MFWRILRLSNDEAGIRPTYLAAAGVGTDGQVVGHVPTIKAAISTVVPTTLLNVQVNDPKELVMQLVRSWIWANFGHCSRCMRTSYRLMLFGILALLICIGLTRSWIAILLSCAVLLLVVIWLMHLIVFAAKQSLSKHGVTVSGTRRKLLASFVAGIASATLVSTRIAAQDSGAACSDLKPCTEPKTHCCGFKQGCYGEDAYCEKDGTDCCCDADCISRRRAAKKK